MSNICCFFSKQLKIQRNHQVCTYISSLIFFINLPRPVQTFLFLKCSLIVCFGICISFLFAFRKIEEQICSCNWGGYCLISSWSNVWYCFMFSFDTSFLMRPKFIILKFVKKVSALLINSLHLFCRYQVFKPSFSYHSNHLVWILE